MDYLSFDLRLQDWDPTRRSGVAEVLQSPVGEAERYRFLLPPEWTLYTTQRPRTRGMAREWGLKLTQSILSRESLTLWYESYQIARERNRGLRLRLHIDAWELTRLPWELLYDSRRDDFFVFDPMISLVRYLRLHAAPPALRPRGSLKVLVLAASPTDQVQLDWQREVEVLNDALRDLTTAGLVTVTCCEHATREKLHLALLESAPDVVHLIGHAEYDQAQHRGVVSLENERGQTDLLDAANIARMLQRYGVNLVVLNACETANGAWAGLAPALVRAEIPAVVAMQWPVEDRAAIRFSGLFYKALSLGRTLDECMAEGRIGASTIGGDPNDWAAPVLFLRSVSGRLWTEDTERAGSGLRDRQVPLRTSPEKALAPSLGSVPFEPDASDEKTVFRTRGPLLPRVEGDLFIDRPELRRALRLAQQPSVTQYIAFLGARQTGKTTLLLRMMEQLRGRFGCTFIDLSVLRAQDARACYRFVAFRLISELRALYPELALPQAPQIESSIDFLEFLRELAATTPMPRILVLLDEVGALSSEASDSFFNTLRTVFTQGRGLSNELTKYLFVFSGAVDLYALTYGANSPLNICEKLYLRDFDRPDVASIVRQFDRLGVRVPEEANTQIYDLTGGHPYLAMRLCALLEQAGVRELTSTAIEQAVEQMLVEDDNIRHVIHELERRPAERRRMRAILLQHKQTPFSRNDPVLASLEMIGAVRPSQPCSVRNRIYERALVRYFEHREEDTVAAAPVLHPEMPPSAESLGETYARLRALRCEALGAEGAYRHNQAWESFVAALFSLVPAFSLYPEMQSNTGEMAILLEISPDMPGGQYWATYQPAILVDCANLGATTLPEALSAVAEEARVYDIRLAFLLVAGQGVSQGVTEQVAAPGGADVCVVALDDAEIARVLEEEADLDAFLRSRVLATRLRGRAR